MNTDDALKTQHDLETKLDDAKMRHDETHAAISKIAFAAHTGDVEAKKRLGLLHLEKAKFAAEIDSLDVALTEARRRVAEARAAEAEGVAAENARKAITLLESFANRGAALDEKVTAIVDEFNGLSRDFRELDRLGFAPSSWPLIKINMVRALESRLMHTDLRVTFLAPADRKDFVTVIAGWAQNVKNRAEARLNKTAAGKAA